jgi:hypothetical protein
MAAQEDIRELPPNAKARVAVCTLGGVLPIVARKNVSSKG